MTLTYQYGDKLYLNITNRCCCNCTFCIRQDHEGVGDGDNLWLEREPTAREVIKDIEKRDLALFREVVFCGYGEPLMALDVFLEVARFLRARFPGMPIRLNTNGLGALIHQKPVAPLLEGLVDIVSISLNAPTAARYVEVTAPEFGEDAFGAMLRFARDCRDSVPRVLFSVVDILEPGEVEACRVLAEEIGIPLRVRAKM